MNRFITRQIPAPAALLMLLVCMKGVYAATEEKAKNYTVRIVTFSAPELAASRAAMMTAPQEENALFAQMTELVGSGGAEVASDTIMRGGPGKWSASANDETPYPTEFDVDPKWRQVIPNSFTFRNVGVSVEATIEEGTGGHPPLLNFSWQRTRCTEGRIFPVITVKTFSQIEQPGFLTDKITGRITLAGGRWRLAGMMRPGVMEGAGAEPPHTLLTFVKVWDGSPSPEGAPAASTEKRLHLFVFRVPVEEGMGMATRPAGSDEPLLESLLDRAESGEIQLAGHAACRLSPNAKAKAEKVEESPADPFAKSAEGIGASKAENIHEYAYATGYDPDPSSFSFRNLGHSLTVTPDREDKTGSGLTIVEWKADDVVKQLPATPQPEGATMTYPEWSMEVLKCRVVPSPGSVRLAGAVLRREVGGPRMMHIFFLKCAGPAVEFDKPQMDHTEAWTALVSLPASEGARLAARGTKREWEDIEPLVKSGTARVLAWQGVGGKKETVASVERDTDTPAPAKAAIHPAAGGMVYGTDVTFYGRGDSTELKLPAGSGAHFYGSFKVSLAKPEPPSLPILLAAAREGTHLPTWFLTETVFPGREYPGPPLKYFHPQVVRFAPCTARAGHAEHGRWHGIVLIMRSN